MSLFKEKEQISRKDFRKALMEVSGTMPGDRRRFFRREGLAFERKVFSKTPGPLVSKGDYERALKEFEKEKYLLRRRNERVELKRKVDFLKELGGVQEKR